MPKLHSPFLCKYLHILHCFSHFSFCLKTVNIWDEFQIHTFIFHLNEQYTNIFFLIAGERHQDKR